VKAVRALLLLHRACLLPPRLPAQTFIELVCWNVFFWGLLYYILNHTGFPKPLGLPPKSAKRKLSWIDYLLVGTLCMNLVWVVWYKYVTETLIYLLQPCHIVSALLVYLICCTNVRRGSMWFAIFTHINVGTLLAIGFPDTRDYYRRGYWPHFTVCIPRDHWRGPSLSLSFRAFLGESKCACPLAAVRR